MKQRIKIFSVALIALSLTAFGFINWNAPRVEHVEVLNRDIETKESQRVEEGGGKPDLDLVYHVDSRFIATITKQDLNNATSVLDIVPKSAEDWKKLSFQTVTIAILNDNDEVREMGDSGLLSANQIKLLQETDYSTNFYIRALATTGHPTIGSMQEYAYYFTVIPEKETKFINGEDGFINYLKEESKEETAIIKRDKLKPCKIGFTITAQGTIADVKLMSTSGYSSVDERLVELITRTPGKWQPAENSNGEKVDQELVFSFGLMGC